MLARANRVIRADDFRRIVRRGRRSSSGTAVFYAVDRAQGEPARFGFIVSRAVGNSVHRNLLRRRWRAVAREVVDAGYDSRDIVIRALPGAGEVPWTALRAEAIRHLAPERVAS